MASLGDYFNFLKNKVNRVRSARVPERIDPAIAVRRYFNQPGAIRQTVKRVGQNVIDLPMGLATAVGALTMSGEQLLKFNPRVTEPTYAKRIGGTFFDVATLPLGAARVARGAGLGLKTASKPLLRTALTRGAEGAAYGGIRALSQGEKPKTALQQAALGGVLGAGVGGLEVGVPAFVRSVRETRALPKPAAGYSRAFARLGGGEKTVFPVAEDTAKLINQRKAATNQYRVMGATEITGVGKENAGLRILESQFNTPQGKRVASQELADQIAKGKIKPNADGTITVYRGGKMADNVDLVSVSTDKEAAKKFGEVTELRVRPEDVAVSKGLDPNEMLVKKGGVRGEGLVYKPSEVSVVGRGKKRVFVATQPRTQAYSQVDYTGKPISLPTEKSMGQKLLEAPKTSEELKLLPQPNKNVAREVVQANLQGKYNNLEQRLYGSTTSEVVGGTEGTGVVGRVTLPVQEKISSGLGRAMASKNPIVRNVASGLRTLFGNTGKTQELSQKLGQVKGADATAIQLANDVESCARSLVNGSEESLKKIHAVLDPDISGTAINAGKLSEAEKKLLGFLREVSDYINDSNFAQGKISYDTWEKGTGGRYIARAYDEYELPPELSNALSDMKRGRQELGMFKQRGDITDWKLDHAIEDPAYLVSKRLQQTYRNQKLSEYASWLSTQADKVSNVEKAGFSKLTESPVWGELSGKYVRKDILEGIRGFYSDHKAVQGIMDALNWYDKLSARRFLKKTKTVYNPVTRVGNQIGNRMFALLNGINPVTFEKNMQTFAKKELSQNGKYTRYLRENGVLGSDYVRTELVNRLAGNGADKNLLQKVDQWVTESYADADDLAKVVSFKYWLDKGKTTEEALRKTKAGFQDYSSVGLLYDIGAKIPVFGNAFVRFQGDLVRILKNAILENPAGVVGMVGGIYALGKLTSLWSGETEEDRQTRISRLGVPRLPFTNIPLEFNTPWGAVNAARLFGLYDITPQGEGVSNRISRQMPIQIPANKKELGAAITSDPLLGGIIGAISNIDFRGKSVRDPNENKYQPTALTPTEQNVNRLDYLSKSYLPPLATDIRNIYRATKGEPSVWGTQLTPTQAALRLGGVKVQQFGPQQAEETRQRDLSYQMSGEDAKIKQINQVIKDRLEGKINEKTANKRIENLQKGTSLVGGVGGDNQIMEYGGQFHILLNGSRKSFDTPQEAQFALDKNSFDRSGKKQDFVNDTYFYRKSNGDIGSYTKREYENKLNDYSMDLAYEKNDYQNWLGLANNQLTYLKEEWQNADDLRKLDIEKDVIDLIQKMDKYAGYGGFRKGKGGGSRKKARRPAVFSATKTRLKASRSNVGRIRAVAMPKPTITASQLANLR